MCVRACVCVCRLLAGLTPSGDPHFAPGTNLFGHACSDGGVVLRPTINRVLCGHGRDSVSPTEHTTSTLPARYQHTTRTRLSPTRTGPCPSPAMCTRCLVGLLGSALAPLSQGRRPSSLLMGRTFGCIAQGAHCDGICEHLLETDTSGPPCHGAWAPRDIGVYLKRETDAYRSEPG